MKSYWNMNLKAMMYYFAGVATYIALYNILAGFLTLSNDHDMIVEVPNEKRCKNCDLQANLINIRIQDRSIGSLKVELGPTELLAKACCLICADHDMCVAWTWEPASGICDLKASVSMLDTKVVSGFISGFVGIDGSRNLISQLLEFRSDSIKTRTTGGIVVAGASTWSTTDLHPSPTPLRLRSYSNFSDETAGLATLQAPSPQPAVQDEGVMANDICDSTPSRLEDGSILPEKDFPGGDIDEIENLGAQSCCDACKRTDACVAFVFKNPKCYLKRSYHGKRRLKLGLFAGNMQNIGSDGCTLQRHTDYLGGDLFDFDIAARFDCCRVCIKNPKCNAYSFSATADRCYLKSRAHAPAVFSERVTSGRVLRTSPSEFPNDVASPPAPKRGLKTAK